MKKLRLSVSRGTRPVDPLQLFQKLTLRGSIENIWEPQADALREWHKMRADADVVIEMNTGGGKTLVGLLLAQSLVNETQGKILYVCANNQLVEQTNDRAREIGLTPALRYKGDWTEREVFDSGDTFCLTNYAAVFNGLSVFRHEQVDALVFDDAHVAENTIRGQFSLKIPNDHDAFGMLVHLCRKHFANSSKASHFDDVAEGRHASVLLVPMFVVLEHVNEFRKILLEAGVDEQIETKFAWEHLKDHLNHCCFLADGNGMEITPPVLPLSQQSCFQPGVRRVYLTATLPSQASFARTFGVYDPTVVRPTGKSGDAQRLIVFVPGENDEEQRDAAKELVDGRKSCVISPSYKKGQEWVPPATIYETQAGQDEIDRFRKSTEAEMLALVARYDGIDLPGDACRLLILDRLPTGECLLDLFIDQSIQIETIRIAHTATRVVQAIGRIFRSNTDHGVVFLVGPQLQAWVRSPRNRAYLPALLQQQLLLGSELANLADQDETSWEELVEAILSGDDNWDATYDEHIDAFEASIATPDVDWHIQLIAGEQSAFDRLWDGQFRQAADSFASVASQAEEHDKRLSAWLRHWQGLALLCATDRTGAFQAFVAAANVRSELGRPSLVRESAFKPSVATEVGPQARSLANWYRKRKTKIPTALKQVEDDLVYGAETNKAEEALRVLGVLIGVAVARPDKSEKTGPDVTWRGEGDTAAWGFELKTDKDADGEYSKSDVSQCHDHREWMQGTYGDNCELTIVGHLLSVSEQANPSPELRITEVDALRDLLSRAKQMHEAVESADQADLERTFQSWLNHYGLRWPGCVESLDSRLAMDLKDA